MIKFHKLIPACLSPEIHELHLPSWNTISPSLPGFQTITYQYLIYIYTHTLLFKPSGSCRHVNTANMNNSQGFIPPVCFFPSEAEAEWTSGVGRDSKAEHERQCRSSSTFTHVWREGLQPGDVFLWVGDLPHGQVGLLPRASLVHGHGPAAPGRRAPL